MSPELLARLTKEAEAPAGVAPVVDAPELRQLLEERAAALEAVRQLYERLAEEMDITWNGGPNLAMRILSEMHVAFGVARRAER